MNADVPFIFQSYQGSILTETRKYLIEGQNLSILSRFNFNGYPRNQEAADLALSILSRFNFNQFSYVLFNTHVNLSILSRFNFNTITGTGTSSLTFFQSYQGSILTELASKEAQLLSGFQSYQGSILTNVNATTTMTLTFFQSYQGSILTKVGRMSQRCYNPFNPIKVQF